VTGVTKPGGLIAGTEQWSWFKIVFATPQIVVAIYRLLAVARPIFHAAVISGFQRFLQVSLVFAQVYAGDAQLLKSKFGSLFPNYL
jgi:hypothetical protein